MAKYGSYIPGLQDPVIAERIKRNQTAASDNARAEMELSAMNDRAGVAYDQGLRGTPNDIRPEANRIPPIAAVAPRMPVAAPEMVAPPRSAPSSFIEAAKKFSPPEKDDLTGLTEGAFNNSRNSPDWGRDVSVMQLAKDHEARAGISDRYMESVSRNNAEERLRGNPMEDAIRAKQRTAAYEMLMPAFSGRDEKGNPLPYEPTLKLNGVDQPQEHAPSFPSRGDVVSIDRARAMADAQIKPTDRVALDNADARQVSMEKIKRAMAAGQAKGMTPQQIAEYLKPILDVEGKKGALGEGDYKALASLLYPSSQNFMNDAAGLVPGNR